jgi:hypothetical protein
MNNSMAAPTPTPGPMAMPRRGRWLRRVVWLVLASVALSVLTLLAVLGDLLPAPLDITINGTSVASGLDMAALPAAHRLALAVLVAVVLLAVLVLALAAFVVAAVALVPVLLLTVGLPVLVAGVVLLALFSPFVLLAWVLWRALRSPRAATMTA